MSELHFPAGVEGVLSISKIDFENKFYFIKTVVTHDKIMHFFSFLCSKKEKIAMSEMASLLV